MNAFLLQLCIAMNERKKKWTEPMYITQHIYIYITLIILYRCKRVTRLNRLTEEKWIRRENERNKTICDVKIAVKERKTFFFGNFIFCHKLTEWYHEYLLTIYFFFLLLSLHTSNDERHNVMSKPHIHTGCLDCLPELFSFQFFFLSSHEKKKIKKIVFLELSFLPVVECKRRSPITLLCEILSKSQLN